MSGILHRQVALGPLVESPGESLSELYHENTKRRPSILGERNLETPPYSAEQMHAMARAHKLYRYHPRVALPAVADLPPNPTTFDEVIARRRSGRRFADADLDLAELSKVLHQTYGITGHGRFPGGTLEFRAAPSAGALYPAEIYLGIRRVIGVAPGIYHYNVPDHNLALLTSGDPTAALFAACGEQEYVHQAGVIVLIAGAMQRLKSKYGERGYRYVWLDLGHLAENMYLACTALGLAITTTGGFYDDAASDLVGLDGLHEAVLYVAFVGKAQAATGQTVVPNGVEQG